MQLTTGTRAPQTRMSEKDRMRPILAEMFSCMRGVCNEELGYKRKCGRRQANNGTKAPSMIELMHGDGATYMCTGIEALGTISSVK